ncbi:RHS repeat-associated core domain-containing protein [Vibrio vulnificus]
MNKCGRVVEKTEYKDGFRPKTTRFVWNGDDRLTHIELPDGGRYRYRYDPLGRRVAKECLSTQRITEYLWDGANIVQHSQKTADGSVIQEIEYLYEPETFRPLAQVTHKANQASQLHYIVTDHAGTPQELCSENGDVVWQGEQALWGHYQQKNALPNHGFRENAQNDELYCDLRYQGQIEDRESGLYYNVNRYYDADSGQYLSPDPIGFAGGLRPQAYVFNPLEWVDPLGLTPLNQGGFSVYGLYEPGASKPYYVGLSNNPDTRGLQHLKSGRLSGNSQLRVLKDDLNYSQARGYEQAYIEKYNTKTGTIGEPISSTNKGNKINSFDKNRTDPRGQAFNDEYEKANQDINGNTKGKSCG